MAVLISLHCASRCLGFLCLGSYFRVARDLFGERAFQVSLANIADPMANGNFVRPNEGDFVVFGEVFVQGFVRQ